MDQVSDFDGVNSPRKSMDVDSTVIAEEADIIEKYKNSDEFIRQKREISNLMYGDILSLRQEKLSELEQNEAEYKLLLTDKEEVDPEQLEQSREKWLNSLKEYLPVSAALNEKRQETNDDHKLRDFILAVGMTVLEQLSPMTPVERQLSDYYDAYTTIQEKEQEERKNETDSRVERPAIAGPPDPPEKEGLKLPDDYCESYTFPKYPEVEVVRDEDGEIHFSFDTGSNLSESKNDFSDEDSESLKKSFYGSADPEKK